MEKQDQNPDKSTEMPEAAQQAQAESQKQAAGAPNAAPAADKTEMYMEWFTIAHRHVERTKGWYVGMGLMLALFIAYDLYTGGWIVSLTFLILAGVYYMMELKPTPVIKVGLNQLGIRYGTKFYAFDQIKAFWIINQADARHLNLILFKGGQRNVDIIIPVDVNIAKIREFLLLQIPEEEGKTEHFSDQLIRNMGL